MILANQSLNKGQRMHQIIGVIFFALALLTAGIALGAHLENKRWLKKSIRSTLSDDEKTWLIRDLSEGQLKWPPGVTYPGSSDIYREIRKLMDKASDPMKRAI